MTVDERSPDLKSFRADSIYPEDLPYIEGIIPELFPSGPWQPKHESESIWPRELTSSALFDNARQSAVNAADKIKTQEIDRMLVNDGIAALSMVCITEIRVPEITSAHLLNVYAIRLQQRSRRCGIEIPRTDLPEHTVPHLIQERIPRQLTMIDQRTLRYKSRQEPDSITRIITEYRQRVLSPVILISQRSSIS